MKETLLSMRFHSYNISSYSTFTFVMMFNVKYFVLAKFSSLITRGLLRSYLYGSELDV